MRKKGLLHHIELNVADLHTSLHFWGWLLSKLGYSIYQSWEKGQSWKLDETYIVFVQTREKHLPFGYHRGRTGVNHLAFHLDTKEEVDDFASLLKERGITILYKDKHPYAGGLSHYAVYFEDPNRIKVELVATATEQK
ncbi:VOC family protein [Bacillus sp. A116_S68]|jgi:catechol 2,3-dioxygenase-like lactoylglutathione lyase family enzyme|nr:VOC family protein [Bacillus sp. A116_S68]